jgi:hypothetical protein
MPYLQIDDSQGEELTRDEMIYNHIKDEVG